MSITVDQITIRPFQPEHQAAAQKLILTGLEEHWGTLDPSFNQDLNDIASTYASGIFLTAWLGDRLVGTGALIPSADHTAEIVRMSVDTSLRRMGIGRGILDALIEQAKSDGYQRIILETTNTWEDAKGFYRSYGFEFTHYQGDDIYFALNLD
jgi:ribosomal protein S18 acetylase RimI-like enzyme